MENYRIILAITLIFLASLIYTKWLEFSEPATDQVVKAQQKKESISEASTTPDGDDPEIVSSLKVMETPEKPINQDKVLAETGQLKLEFSNVGGAIIGAELKEYYKSEKEKDSIYQLVGKDSGLLKIQNGIIDSKKILPSHKSLFRIDKKAYELGSADSLKIPFYWENDQARVVKTYTLNKDTYEVDLSIRIENKTDKAINIKSYWQEVHRELGNSSTFMNTYSGGTYYSEDLKYNEITYSDLNEKPLKVTTGPGWFSYVTHYFIGAVIPENDNNIYSKKINNEQYLLGSHTQDIEVAANGYHEVKAKLWLGPKLQYQLEKLAPGLELTVDYDWLTIIAKPIFWLLTHIHDLLGNWGWSIVVLTLLIKLAFYRLSAASYRSMANMRKLAPQMQALKERYGEDKEKFNKAMMEFYQKEKINPLGGCLPIAVQIPVFIALYWVLMESVELRGAPFIFWIDNLSAKDPLYILPVIMGVSMFVQQKLNPQPPDPMQAKIMQALPFVFTAFFAFFPAGLVLYWVVNNLLSILQQWRITSLIEKGETKT
jgi:YidC/Oxa1 family membrane protein insertase